MRNGIFIRIFGLLLMLTGCGASTNAEAPGPWSLATPTNLCPEGATLVDSGLPNIDVFEQPICLANHAAEEVQVQESLRKLLRPECSTDIFGDPRDYGLYGRVDFITNKRITSENNFCTTEF